MGKKVRINLKSTAVKPGRIFKSKVPSSFDYIEYDTEEYFKISAPPAKPVDMPKGQYWDSDKQKWVDF